MEDRLGQKLELEDLAEETNFHTPTVQAKRTLNALAPQTQRS